MIGLVPIPKCGTVGTVGTGWDSFVPFVPFVPGREMGQKTKELQFRLGMQLLRVDCVCDYFCTSAAAATTVVSVMTVVSPF